VGFRCMGFSKTLRLRGHREEPGMLDAPALYS
jgi:hypothetical protein